MDAGPLDVLHDARDHNVLPVANGVHLDLLALDVFIHQDRMLLGDPVDDANEFVDIPVVDGEDVYKRQPLPLCTAWSVPRLPSL